MVCWAPLSPHCPPPSLCCMHGLQGACLTLCCTQCFVPTRGLATWPRSNIPPAIPLHMHACKNVHARAQARRTWACL